MTCLDVAEELREIAVDAGFNIVLYYVLNWIEALGHPVPHGRYSIEKRNRRHRIVTSSFASGWSVDRIATLLDF